MNVLTAIRLLIALARALEIPPEVIADFWNDVNGNQVYFDKLLSLVNDDAEEVRS